MHGDAAAFTYAAGTDRFFVVQLGDLTDYGPRSAEVLTIMFRLIDEGRGLFLLGNHDHKLARALAGQPVRAEANLQQTLAQLDTTMRERALVEISRAPAWLRQDGALFVHGGFHADMLTDPAPEVGVGRARVPSPARCSGSQPGGCRRTAIRSAALAGWIGFRAA